jgi:hypothetical protein
MPLESIRSFRCEGCGQRVVSHESPVVFSHLAMGCSLACTLLAVEQQYRACKTVLKTKVIPQPWRALMEQAEMRPQQWLKLTEQELRFEWARLKALVHREQLEREAPELLARLDQARLSMLQPPPPQAGG